MQYDSGEVKMTEAAKFQIDEYRQCPTHKHQGILSTAVLLKIFPTGCPRNQYSAYDVII